jgi:hypothetical protein
MPTGFEPLYTGGDASREGSKVQEQIRVALDAEPRVEELHTLDPIQVDNARTLTFFDRRADQPEILTGADEFEALRLPRPFVFKVRVPIKNQPKYRNVDDIPTDTYTVMWGGTVLAAQWDQPAPFATMSGGHVVLEVLSDVVDASGYALEIFSCAAECLYKFVHADVVTFTTQTPPDEFTATGGGAPTAASIAAPFSRQDDPVVNLRKVLSRLYGPFEQYAVTRSLADKVLELENLTRENAANLMRINYLAASRRRLPNPKALKDMWPMRHARAESRRILASMWLSLSLLETYERQWRRAVKEFDQLMSDQHLHDFEDALTVSREEILSLDISLIKASLSEVGNRLDSKSVIGATAFGALAALAGAAASPFG